jgi:hypothetical protein
MLKRIDDIDVFPQNELLPDSFLLLGGRVIIFDLPFLEYVNDPKHQWWTCLRAPYGTNL